MILQIIQTIWFFLPAGFANMFASLSKRINFLNYPINKKLFGSNKTYRGFLFGVLAAIIICFIQFLLYPYTKTIAITNYSNFILIGFLLGFGALLGDLIESFFKRRIKIKPGKSWPIFDQLDWIIGAIILSSLYIRLSATHIIIAIIFAIIIHPTFNLLGYNLRLQKNKF
jgi:CDP-2,3-bis-(O-geranylgeranyl)-sn-glycerol synthase